MVSRFPSFWSSFSSVFILVVIVVIVEIQASIVFCERIENSNSNPAQDVIVPIIHDIAVRIERHGNTTSFAREEMEI